VSRPPERWQPAPMRLYTKKKSHKSFTIEITAARKVRNQ